MNIYQLQCLTEDGNLESNGYFLNKEDAEIEKYKLDEQPHNLRFGIKQQVLTHEVIESTSPNSE